jgi:tetratricopeptide (TPR) repeat protein
VERTLTAAEQRAAEVRTRRGERIERVEPAERVEWEREQWIDEGSLRDAAEAATGRALGDGARQGRRRSNEIAPEVADDLSGKVEPARMARYQERLTAAADALDRGRFGDAHRMVRPVLRDVPDLAFGHELAGLALYRLGQWRKAAAELEVARGLSGTVAHHAVLADCYRALRRYTEVDQLWLELRDASPEPELMAEGRIVAAGALADQGDLVGALKVMEKGMTVPKKPKDRHVRQWYVIADLLDRSGDVVTARRYFTLVANADPEFADVRDRLRGLGR